jgi:iron complex outermembrane receptor protein
MKPVSCLLIWITVLFAFTSATAAAQDLFSMPLQDLMDATVITAARHEQKIANAPAAMSVVTAEDIRQLGAISLGEALQMAVGLHLGYTNAPFMMAGGIRGFHKLPANKIMLLIDGIPWSLEMYGLPAFFQLPISLQEIEKIEIMRGPGSSLYGSNAMFGVINVITKKTRDTRGTLLSATAGENDTLIGTCINGGTVAEKLDYRMTLEWDQTDNSDYIAWSNDPAQQYGKTNITMNYPAGDTGTLTMFAGYLRPENLDLVFESTGPLDWSGADTFDTVIAYTATAPKISVKAHYKNSDWSNGESLGVKNLNFRTGLQGIEFQHEITPASEDTLIWGANINQEYAEGPSIDGKHTHDKPGIFVDNTYRFTDQVGLNTGLRYDHHPNTGSTYSHRLSLLYSPVNDHHFRMTWGSSYRNPDFIESYYSRFSPYGDNQYLHVYGQEDNDAEKAATYELGYVGRISENCLLTTNIFYSELKDFVYFIQSGDPYLDPNLGGIVIPFPFKNIGDAKQYGAETEIQYQVTQWLNALANYTYIDQKEQDDPVRQLLEMTPQHMASGQLRAKFTTGISANLALHYKDSTDWRQYIWPSPEGNTIAGGHAGSYVYVNLRVGYAFKLKDAPAEVAVSAFNLFDRGFDDYPMDTSDVSRRVTGSFSLRF